MKHRVSIPLAALGVAALMIMGAPAGSGAARPDLTASVDSALRDRLGAQATTAYGLSSTPRTLVEPKRHSPDGRWAFGGGAFLMPSNTHGSPVTALFVAHLSGGQWKVALEGTPAFADLSRRAPDSVVKSTERAPFARTAAPAAAATGLALPWKQGTGWGHWGVHGNGGNTRPYNSIDFYGGDGRVLTSRAGTMYRFCTSGGRWPFIKVVHDNGYTTGYYHLRDTTNKSDGSSVALGEYVGMIDVQLPCGGRANGDHVHWTLWQGSTAIAVNSKSIGGWTWWESSTAYQGYAERSGTRIYRNQCCRLVNYGG
ncbi:M23 family metallopeptidase [Spirillospora sp. CA-294931]|uniref:M23 family metallopeptidase n=1 Tax=Spirillospora sp. CA-294931 TaxID=3240042 RepID=UPI003D8FB345